MTAATAATPHRFGLHTRGMAVGLASGRAGARLPRLIGVTTTRKRVRLAELSSR